MSNFLAHFWSELKRRKVVRVAVAYAVVAWVLVEVSSVVFPALLLPEWAARLVVVLALVGFPVAVVMAWVFETSPAGIRREVPAGAAVLAADPVRKENPAKPDAVLIAEERPDDRRSVVVLPFANLSEDPENEYFSDGITEEILNLLARQPELRVVSRTTSFTFKGSPLDIRAIADRLGVKIVLEGSVRRAGRRVRITAQLIDAENDAHLWSNSFDREIDDIFTVQSEIARSIVDAMDIEPGACAECEVPTEDIEAYDYYLKGRQYFHSVTESGLKFALQMFRKAIEKDPEFARAYAGLADTHSLIAQWLDRSPENLAAADRASRQALRLAPHLAESHSSRGFALTLNGDFNAASREFEQALELDPDNYDALYLYGRSRFAAGCYRDAARLWLRAHATQPDEYQSIALVSSALKILEPEQAAEATRRAVVAVEKRLELNPDDVRALSLGSGLLVESGRIEEGLDMARRSLELAPNDISVMYNASCCFARAGHNEEALELLARRLQHSGTIYREWVEHDNDFDGLRDDPRFIALLEKMPRAGG
jgi:adenylate cyclase